MSVSEATCKYTKSGPFNSLSRGCHPSRGRHRPLSNSPSPYSSQGKNEAALCHYHAIQKSVHVLSAGCFEGHAEPGCLRAVTEARSREIRMEFVKHDVPHSGSKKRLSSSERRLEEPLR